jgi:hypothetical protein
MGAVAKRFVLRVSAAAQADAGPSRQIERFSFRVVNRKFAVYFNRAVIIDGDFSWHAASMLTCIMIWRVLMAAPWVVFCVYWLLGALKTKRTMSKEPFGSRYGVLVLEVGGFILVFTELGGVGTQYFLARTYVLAITGVAFTWVGIGIAVWARWHLGQYWSARVTLKEGHQLIRTGPYASIWPRWEGCWR